jgi:FtsP/CotA-like multicopper oxidase with cupredoxin domain
MSSGMRIGLILAAVAAVVVAFVLLSPGGDDEPATNATTTAAGRASGTVASPGPTSTPPAPAGPAFQTIRVRGGEPAGGVRTITLAKGDRARIEVSSSDTSDEIHLHGYDLKRDLKAGGRVRFSFVAEAEGIFEIELEGAGVQIGKLVVEP